MHSSLSALQSQDSFDPAVDVPECLQKYLSIIENPQDLYPLIKENRAHRAQLLTRRFYNQIQHGCKNSACHVPTCLSYRKRVATGPVRLYNEVTARALAIRCVERYVHRGRDIDRVSKRDKTKKVLLHSDALPNDGLCYSDPVVPWYANSTEYLSKRSSAARRESLGLKTRSRQQNDGSSPRSVDDESAVPLYEESRRRPEHETAAAVSNGMHSPRPVASTPETALDTTSNTASSASSMNVSPPSPPTEARTRLDTSSLTQSLFSASAIIELVNGSCVPHSLYGATLAEHTSKHIHQHSPLESDHATSTLGGTRTRTFSLLPASVLHYLKCLLLDRQVTDSEDQSMSKSSGRPQIEEFVDQSISYVLTNPHRLLSSACTWDRFIPYDTKTGLPTSFKLLAEAETCTAAEPAPLTLPNWHSVCMVCDEVLHYHRRRQGQQSRIFAHLQRLIKHAYICPAWLRGSSRRASDTYLDNRTVAYLICLITNIAISTLQITPEFDLSTTGHYKFLAGVSEEWVYRPDVMQLAVNIADVFSHRHLLDVALISKLGSSLDKQAAKKTGIVHTLVAVLSNSKMASNRLDEHNDYASSLLDMMRSVIVMRWDRSPIINRDCPVAGALEVLKGLYRVRKQCYLKQARFTMNFIGEALDELEMPHEWLEFRPDAKRIHILQFPFLLPDEYLVSYFRSINLKIMKHSYDKAMGTYTIGSAQLLLGKWHVRNVHEVLQKIRPHMARYFVMTVRRDHMLEDAIGQIWHREHQELIRPLKVRMGEEEGEVGLDHGGVQQELFRLMFNEAFNSDYGMFDIDQKSRMTWFKPGSLEPLYKFEALGLLVSLAIYNGITIPMNMPLALYRIILGLKVKTIEHIEDGWPELARSFEQLLAWDDGDVGDVICRTYEFSFEAFGKVESVNMKREQSDMNQGPCSDSSEEAPLVTNANREAFVKDYILHLTSKSLQLQAFVKGVKTLLSPQALSLFPPERLKILFEGHPTAQSVDVSAWKATTTYEDYSISDPVIAWFWEVLTEDFSQDQLRKLLEFVTASDRIPIGGWNGITFIIQRNAAGNEWLPASSTCYGRLFLPEYSSKEILKKKLEKAIETNYGFGMV